MDKIFKIGLLVLGFLYLAYLFCPVANQVGRYEFNTVANVSLSVLDTATADLYLMSKENKWMRMNPITETKGQAK